MRPMSRKTLSTLASIIVVVIVAIITACTHSGGSDNATDPGAAASTSSASSATATSTPTYGEGPDGEQKHTGTDPVSGLPWIAVSQLPAEAQHELDLIDAGGPFSYPGKDGSTFGNYEGILPDEARGYYREYTVDTPGSDDRGARRIITGSGGEFYYTDDHYESFSRIDR